MIVSASRRTDIPAYYALWFEERIRRGFCEVPNPFNPSQVSRIPLVPEEVDAIVFWTRNPAPIASFVPELERRGFRFYFQITLLDYPSEFEPHLPRYERRLEAFRRLADLIGPERTLWRYDPILLTAGTGPDFHLRTFSRLAADLSGSTRRCTVSLLEEYKGIAGRLAGLSRAGYPLLRPDPESPLLRDLLSALNAIARTAGMEMVSCASHDETFREAGIPAGRCVDADLLSRVYGITVDGTKDPGQRSGCLCAKSRDIGVYGTCPAGCRYCYATKSFDRAAANRRRHDQSHPSLLPP